MDRALVYKWLDIADGDIKGVGDDRYVIAFAQFGKYAKSLNSPNSWVSAAEPKAGEVPWAHFLKKRAKGVGIHEGGATFKKGVWRPARGCAMNSAGNTGFCPVCREQTILVIYEHVSPIDSVDPEPAREIVITEGEQRLLTVVPMEPHKHKLAVGWYVADRVVTKSEHGEEFDAVQPAAPPLNPRRPRMFTLGGKRARENRSIYNNPPSGKPSKWAKTVRGRGKGAKRIPTRSVFPLAKLPVGSWRVTAQVEDRTKFVLKDANHLLKQRTTWLVTVTERAPPPP